MISHILGHVDEFNVAVSKTAQENQLQISFKIYEGERSLVKDNHFLGKFSIDNFSLGPAGPQRFTITFDLDVNGILTVSAQFRRTELSEKIALSASGNLSKSEVSRVLVEAQSHREEDKAHANRIKAWVLFDEYIKQVQDKVQQPRLNDEEIALLSSAIQRESE